MAYQGAALSTSTAAPNRQVFTFLTTTAQSAFQGADSRSLTLGYNPAVVQVFLNGYRLDASDFTATDGLTVTLATSTNPAGGDMLVVVTETPYPLSGSYAKGESDARYPRMDNTSAMTAAQAAQLLTNLGLGNVETFLGNLLADGCCRFVYSSSTTCVLQPFNGNILFIGGLPYQIPSAGVTLSSAALAANILYYVYAYMAGSVMTLAASTTGYTVDAAGRKNMTGNAVYRLVGMVYCQSAATFTVSNSFVGVLSYFNRRSLMVYSSFFQSSTSSTSPVLIGGSLNFLQWADGFTTLSSQGYASQSTSGSAPYVQIINYVDGTGIGSSLLGNTGGQYSNIPLGSYGSQTFGESYHTAALYGSTSSGTCAFTATLICVVQG